MKTNIIAIGGGNIKAGETLSIDRTIVEQANKNNPRLLFIPTASSDNADYINRIREHFSALQCSVDTLQLIAEKLSHQAMAQKIAAADIIYVGGGNTLRMMTLWRKLGVDTLLDKARAQGTVLSGLSAGSICWFDYGNSDSRKFKNPEADFIRVTGLGFIKALNCPHYHKEVDRRGSVQEMTRKTRDIALALDDGVALHVKGDSYRIIRSLAEAHAYKVYWKHGIFYEEKLESQADFLPLGPLLTR
jgi:dipeptidase E